MKTENSNSNHLPNTVAASLDARLAPFRGVTPNTLEDLDVEVSRAISPGAERSFGLSMFRELKLLFAALGAGGSAVPLGDNGRTARLLSEYAAALRRH